MTMSTIPTRSRATFTRNENEDNDDEDNNFYYDPEDNQQQNRQGKQRSNNYPVPLKATVEFSLLDLKNTAASTTTATSAATNNNERDGEVDEKWAISSTTTGEKMAQMEQRAKMEAALLPSFIQLLCQTESTSKVLFITSMRTKSKSKGEEASITTTAATTTTDIDDKNNKEGSSNGDDGTSGTQSQSKSQQRYACRGEHNQDQQHGVVGVDAFDGDMALISIDHPIILSRPTTSISDGGWYTRYSIILRVDDVGNTYLTKALDNNFSLLHKPLKRTQTAVHLLETNLQDVFNQQLLLQGQSSGTTSVSAFSHVSSSSGASKSHNNNNKPLLYASPVGMEEETHKKLLLQQQQSKATKGASTASSSSSINQMLPSLSKTGTLLGIGLTLLFGTCFTYLILLVLSRRRRARRRRLILSKENDDGIYKDNNNNNSNNNGMMKTKDNNNGDYEGEDEEGATTTSFTTADDYSSFQFSASRSNCSPFVFIGDYEEAWNADNDSSDDGCGTIKSRDPPGWAVLLPAAAVEGDDEGTTTTAEPPACRRLLVSSENHDGIFA